MPKITFLPVAAAVAAIFLSASLASATTCTRVGDSNNFKCKDNDGLSYTVNNAASANAAAAAIAAAKQQQSQGQSQNQGQSQVATGGNAYNGGNSVEISNPKHTTSMTLGVGISFSVPIASGVQTRNAIDTANWYMQNGDPCTAFAIMDRAPRVRALKIKGRSNCGDKN